MGANSHTSPAFMMRGGLRLQPTPAGVPFTQATAQRWSREKHLVFACGRYEGIDARVTEHYRTRLGVREVSLGDYVLNGGEVAVLADKRAIKQVLLNLMSNAIKFNSTDGFITVEARRMPLPDGAGD